MSFDFKFNVLAILAWNIFSNKEKICFYDYSEAAKFINNIYNNNNLNLWWNSDNLQNVRKLFCEKYCRHSKNPINDLKKSLIFNE